MQVTTGGVPGCTGVTDDLPLRNRLARADHIACHVMIFSGQQAAIYLSMVNNHTVTRGRNSHIGVNDRTWTSCLNWKATPTTVVEPGMDVAAATTIIKGAGRCGPPTKPRRLIGIERGDQPPGAASICGCLFDLLLLLFIFFICGFGVTTSFRS